jgi:hypothetical protein
MACGYTVGDAFTQGVSGTDLSCFWGSGLHRKMGPPCEESSRIPEEGGSQQAWQKLDPYTPCTVRRRPGLSQTLSEDMGFLGVAQYFDASFIGKCLRTFCMPSTVGITELVPLLYGNQLPFLGFYPQTL